MATYTKPLKEVVLIIATVEQREALEVRGEWAQYRYNSAEVRRQTFSVAVHGVQRAMIEERRREEAIARLGEANKALHPGQKIVRI